MEANEQYVRSRWEWVAYFEPDADCDVAMVQVASKSALDIREFDSQKPSEAWQAAKDYTLALEEEIRLVAEEIAFMGADLIDCQGIPDMIAIIKRILAREQAALDELKRGMR